jgi:hypothetical protein
MCGCRSENLKRFTPSNCRAIVSCLFRPAAANVPEVIPPDLPSEQERGFWPYYSGAITVIDVATGQTVQVLCRGGFR